MDVDWKARCEALTAERDRLLADAEWRDRWQTRLGRLHQTEGRFYEGIEAKLSRCQHLEQAVKKANSYLSSIRDVVDIASTPQPTGGQQVGPKKWNMTPSTGKELRWNLQQIGIALASLLPAQEETPGTDENRVSFAAGYSTALDDVLKDRKL